MDSYNREGVLNVAEEHEEDMQTRPARKLASDMILRAIWDITGPHDAAVRDDAIGWLLDEDKSIFNDDGISFPACCEILNLKTSYLRHKILTNFVKIKNP